MSDFSAAQRSRVTMLDVAERAKASKASVSSFIGDDRTLLSHATASRRRLPSWATLLRAYNIEGLIVNTLGHHRDVLLVTEPYDGISSRIERVSSFEAQIEQRPTLRGTLLETGSELTAKLKTFLETPGPGPKALFCANGIAALASTHSLRELKCNLFENVGLIAFDDLDWYPLVGSGITALAQPTAEIGARAHECLLKRLRGDDGPVRTLDFSAKLIVRGSTIKLRARSDRYCRAANEVPYSAKGEAVGSCWSGCF